MQKLPFHILRVGIGITFLWIGVLILQNPEGWANLIQPWAALLLPFSPVNVLWATGFFDIALGFLLFINFQIKIASFLAVLHLFSVLLVSGIDAVTVRDIGLLAGAFALFFSTISKNPNEKDQDKDRDGRGDWTMKKRNSKI